MTNRLAHATSPYLLQHKDNPVDWREWGDEAFAEARQRDVPVVLSVGYAACHWCHVMAHESFEDESTAAVLNAGFVSIKVDREERPDVDAVYMNATQALTGQGGWPMTVFLTPDGLPFYAGTYFPPQPLHGRPSFTDVLRAVTQAWTERRDDLLTSSARIAEALGDRSVPEGERPPSADELAQAVRTLAREEDTEYGGFGTAPKFPPSMVCEFLLRHAAVADGETASLARGLVDRTLTAMARSGMYDQLAGGFARYSVDAGWVVPHFEKMLYDNALLARVYLHWWRLTGDLTGRRMAQETCDFLVADLRTPEGAFASALDADTAGVEGKTYVWTPAELADVLGPDEGRWAAELMAVTASGTFEHGTSTAQLLRDPWAGGEGERWERARGALLERRRTRDQPARDDKIVLAWNGLAVAALAETGALCDRPDLVEAARSCAELLVSVHRADDGGWRRVSRDGAAGSPPAVLEDLGDLAEGLQALAAVTGEQRWNEVADEVLGRVLAQFGSDTGVPYDTADADTDPRLALIGRPQDVTDNAYPSGPSAAAGALLTAAALRGDTRMRDAAERALAPASALAPRVPRFVGWAAAVAQALLDGPREVAVVGERDTARDDLHRAALAATAPGLVVALGRPGDGSPALLDGRGLVDGSSAAYVCRGFVCDQPTTDADALARALGARQEVRAGR